MVMPIITTEIKSISRSFLLHDYAYIETKMIYTKQDACRRLIVVINPTLMNVRL